MHKFGFSEGTDQTRQLTTDILAAMEQDGVDFTVFFNSLTRVAEGEPESMVVNLFSDSEVASKSIELWQELRAKDSDTVLSMRHANPAVIARNHQVQLAIEAAVVDNDFVPFRRLCRVLANPYQIEPADHDLMTPPKSEEKVTQTFCGT